MNRNVILISEDTLKENSILNDNCFGKYILPSIIYAQENQLQSVLGTCLYEKIIDMVADGTISLEVSVAYKDLLDNYIQPFLINQTLSEVIVNAGAKVANLGAVISNDEHVSNLSQKEMELLRNSYVEKADFYMKRMQNFLKDNRAAFPELDCNCGNVKPNLDSNTNSIGLWTGGIRGKRSKSSGCGCSSNQSEPHSGQYEDGYRDGFVAGRTSGITEGEAIQRGRMISTAVTENGVYERYDGFKEISVNVNTGHSDQEIIDAFNSGYTSGETVGFESGYASGETVGFESGFTSGETAQKNKLVSTAVTVNGVYEKEDGFSSVEVVVPQTGHTDEEMQQMYQSGITYQKSLLTSINVSQNGQYQREDGYSAITVNVSGQAPSLISTAVTANGEYFPAQGYDGFSSFEVNVSQTGHTDQELQDAYASGYTSGYSSGYTSGEGEGYSSGYSSGEAHQKSLMVSTAITANTTVSRADGFSSVTVNVPQTGHTDAELEAAYNNGYSSGETHQKSLLSAATFYNYGTYTSENGFSSVTFTKRSEDVPLTFIILTGGTITVNPRDNENLFYKINNGIWNKLNYYQAATINVNSGDTLYFKGTNEHYATPIFEAGSTAYFNLMGSMASLKSAGDYIGVFAGTHVVSAEYLDIDKNSCIGMFSACTHLTTAPSIYLPNVSSYSRMFYGCSALTQAPSVLPAATLREGCYSEMFEGCTSLTIAPLLPAKNLIKKCYYHMFKGAPLNEITCLAESIDPSGYNENYPTKEWITSSAGIFTKSANMNDWLRNNDGIPISWSVVNA